jgi:DNA replication protein DnaC
VLRDAAFPRAVYRQTWEQLAAALPEREACKTIVGLLSLAADGHEAQLADELEQLIELDQLPDLQALSDLLVPPATTLPEVMALAVGHEWLDRGANVLLFGPPGVGKSHFVSGLCHALIEAGRRVYFSRCSDLVQKLQAARRDLRLPQEMARLDRFDLLVLDDISYVRRDQAETSVLFELISERYEQKSLAITANTPFSQWNERNAAVSRYLPSHAPAPLEWRSE